MSNFIFVATTTTKRFVKGGAPAMPDKNGKMPVQLTVLAGTAPARSTVVSGTIAENINLEVGNTYVVQATFNESNSYGDQFNLSVLGKPALFEIPKYVSTYGPANVVQTEEGKRVGQADQVEEEEYAENGM